MPMITAGGSSKWLGETLADRRMPVHDGLGWLPGPVEDALLHRSSVREFSTDPLPAARVQDAIVAALDAESAAWPARQHGTAAFAILVAAFNLDGLTRGLYPAHGSQRLADADCAWLDTLRQQYADAPALLLICGDLNRACRSAGPAGYASMLVRAGSIGYAAWLWAVSAGLGASVYGSASHRVTGAARLLDVNLRHLFTVALGMPAPAPVTRS
jgi:hypothetical protein